MDPANTAKPMAGQLEAELSMFIGAEEWFRHFTRRINYTPGVRHLAIRAGAYWLIDLIASRCRSPKLAGADFQVWRLTVRADRSATLSVTDGNENKLLTCGIHMTDFPLSGISLYLIDGVLLLPSEY